MLFPRALTPSAALLCLLAGEVRAQPEQAPTPPASEGVGRDQGIAGETPVASQSPTTTLSAAQQYAPPSFITAPTELPSPSENARAWRLKRADVIEALLRDNLSVQLERINVEASQLAERAAQGDFEPTVNASYLHRDADYPPNNIQEGMAGEIINTIDNNWALSAAKRFESGTRAEVRTNQAWSQSSQGNAISPDLFRTSVDLSVSQPFLRGFSTDGSVQTAPILRARFASKRALEQARLSAASAILAAENAYWDLTEALKSYQVRLRSWALASQQLKLTERQIQAGVLPPSDRINVEGTLARRELQLVESEANIAQTADRLRSVMNVQKDRWQLPLLTAEAPTFVEQRPNLSSLLAIAEKKRPELTQAELLQQQATLDEKVALNASLPDLSATLGYGLIGQDQNYSGAWNEVRDARGKYWSVFVNLGWTPFNERAGAEADRAATLGRRAKVEAAQLLLNIRMQVRSAARTLETAEKQLFAAAKSRYLAEQSLEAEQRKFQNGMSNNFFVAQRQEELAQAELAELSALIRHEKARTDLELATGVLLDSRRVKLDLGVR